MKKTPSPKRGRPLLDSTEKKIRVLAFRIQKEEADAIDAAAASEGMSTANWMREQLIAAAKTTLSRKSDPISSDSR